MTPFNEFNFLLVRSQDIDMGAALANERLKVDIQSKALGCDFVTLNWEPNRD
jgi:hypothetical protein